MIHEVKLPRLGTNDDLLYLGNWEVKDEDAVQKGQTLVAIESTKETSELESPENGYIKLLVAGGTEYSVNTVVAVLGESKEELNAYHSTQQNGARSDEKEAGRTITKKAQLLMRQHNIGEDQLPIINIIKEKDVLALIDELNRKASSNQEKRDFAAKLGVNDLLILCGGGLGRMCLDMVKSIGGYTVHGFLDTFIPKGSMIHSIEVLGTMEEMLESLKERGLFCAVNAMGSISNDLKEGSIFYRRKEQYEYAKALGFYFPNLIHPRASVEQSVTMGEGNLVFAGAIVCSDAILGNDTQINTGAIVSHDCIIGDHVRMSPGANLAGGVRIGENSLIGIGVNIYRNVVIGKNVVIGNGKSIFSDIPDNTVVK